jgi:hypothetical protein
MKENLDNTWKKLAGSGSPLLKLRHGAKYTSFAHYETAKKYDFSINSMIEHHKVSWIVPITALFGSLIPKVQDVIAASTGASTKIISRSGVLIGVGIFLYKSLRMVYLKKSYEHAGATWLSVFNTGTALAFKPIDPKFTIADFNTEMKKLEQKYSEAAENCIPTVNVDYLKVDAELDKTFRDQDIAEMDKLYTSSTYADAHCQRMQYKLIHQVVHTKTFRVVKLHLVVLHYKIKLLHYTRVKKLHTT